MLGTANTYRDPVTGFVLTVFVVTVVVWLWLRCTMQPSAHDTSFHYRYKSAYFAIPADYLVHKTI